jgi:hypothetical protein
MQKRELDKQQLRSASGFRARLLQRADNFIVVALSHPSDVEHRFYTSDILRRGVGKQPMLNYAPLLQHRSLGIDEGAVSGHHAKMRAASTHRKILPSYWLMWVLDKCCCSCMRGFVGTSSQASRH